MFSITRDEAFYLRKNGFKDYVKVTHSRYKKYFATESYPLINALKRYRESVVSVRKFS